MTEKIERYEIESQLGEGGIGVVYRAFDPALNKVVAIKVLSGSNLTADQQLRFQNEAKALCELKHNSIPEVYDFSISKDGAPYMVMEFIGGRSLDKILADHGKMQPHHAIDVVMQVSAALKHAHAAGIVHRDVKPSNIILCDNEHLSIKLVDFGLAKLENSLSENLFQTKTGAIIGSPPYMSPEQLRSENPDARTDIYSVGCVLYEMLTGTAPFLGETALETASKHLNGQIPFLPDEVEPADLRDELDSIIMQCLAKERDQRFKNADELAKALSAAAEISANARHAAHTSATADDGVPAPSKLRLWVPAAAAVTILSGAVYWFTHSTALLQQPQDPQVGDEHKHTLVEPELNWIYKHQHRAVTSVGDTSDESFKELLTFPELKEVCSEASHLVTGTGCKYIRSKNVSIVKIISDGLTDEGVLEILRLPHLDNLTLGSSRVLSLNTFRAIAASNTVYKIRFHGLPLPKDAMSIICSPHLGYFELKDKVPGSPKTDWSQLANAKDSLYYLSIEQFDFTNDDLKYLAPLSHLMTLRLANLGLEDDNFELLKLPNLETLNLQRNDISDETLKKVAALKLPRLETLHIPDNSRITSKGIRWFEQKTKCKVQTVYGNAKPAVAN